ncbi:MAG: inorganic phosphate transporter [Simkaniaceae bacterium]
MSIEILLIVIVLLVGFYMAWNIGANDVSNAMGTSVGSGALTLTKAVFIAGILEFAGAYFLGSNVSETMQKGIVNPSVFSGDPNIFLYGMLSALLATAIWLQIASYFGWPVSTTHAIVGAILGFGVLIGGVHSVKWSIVGSIALSWILSPALSALISFFIFSILQRKILYAMNPIAATKRLIPLLIFLVFFTFSLMILSDSIRNVQMNLSSLNIFFLSLLIAGTTSLCSMILIRTLSVDESRAQVPSLRYSQQAVSLNRAAKHLDRVRLSASKETRPLVSRLLDEVKGLASQLKTQAESNPHTSDYRVVERMFSFLQIISACFVAFAHGANDVANAIGPVAAIMDVVRHKQVALNTQIPTWLLAFGGFGIVVGLATWGWRVIETIGKKITELTPTRGFSAEFGAATTILLASKLGLPVSTTHCIVGAVLGVGLARGISALNIRMLRDIALSWVITIPSAALVCILLFHLIKVIFTPLLA